MKKSVGIITGGRSVEHEVSVITGLQVYDNIDKNLFEPKIIYIGKDGKWFMGESLHDINNYRTKSFDDAHEVIAGFNEGKLVLYQHPSIHKGLFGKKYSPVEFDVVFPAVHGTNAEDGTLHGMMQMNGVPCAFGSVLSSAVGMDKVIMKKVFEQDGLPIPEYTWFFRSDWAEGKDAVIKKVEAIGYPVMVKPANLGSSVGIGKAADINELLSAIDVAVEYDRKIIVEKCVENVREINCAVMGSGNDTEVSECEEPMGWTDFLTYEDKYVHKAKSSTSEKRRIPADITEDVRAMIKDYAVKAFKAIDCSGNARIDFLYDGNNIYVNEINTIPGSIAFYLWEACGVSFKQLITKILAIAEEEEKERKHNIVSYDVDLLNKMGKGAKIK